MAFSSIAFGEKDIEGIADPDEVQVFYFGFEIEKITGIPSNQVEEYGCKYTTSGNKFLKLLTRSLPRDGSHYERLDVRAKVIFPSGMVYFIDRTGVVRAKKQFFVIDMAEFANALIPLSKGGCQ